VPTKRPYRKTLKLVVNNDLEEVKKPPVVETKAPLPSKEQKEVLRIQLLTMKEKQIDGIKLYF
jgi:hypothetical protein